MYGSKRINLTESSIRIFPLFTQGLLKQFRYRNSDTLATIDPKVDGKEVGQYVLTCCTYPKSNLLLKLQGEVSFFWMTLYFTFHLYMVICTQDEMYVRQWAEGFEGGGVQWGGLARL